MARITPLPELTPDDGHLSPARVVITVLGIRPLARALNIGPSAVWKWDQPRPVGRGGVVPSQYHVSLLELARKRRVKLTTQDLILGRQGHDATTDE